MASISLNILLRELLVDFLEKSESEQQKIVARHFQRRARNATIGGVKGFGGVKGKSKSVKKSGGKPRPGTRRGSPQK